MARGPRRSCPLLPTNPGLATVVGATDVGAQRWAGNRRDSPRGFWRFCRVVPAASSSSCAIASRRAGHAPSPSTRPCSAARGAKGSLAPPVPLNLPFSFRCPIRCPFGNNNNGNVVILLALRTSSITRYRSGGRGPTGGGLDQGHAPRSGPPVQHQRPAAPRCCCVPTLLLFASALVELYRGGQMIYADTVDPRGPMGK